MHQADSTLFYFKHSAGGVAKEASQESNWVPNTDVYTTETSLVIKVELSGLKKEQVELTIEGNRLMINGHREDSCRAAKVNFLMMEINYGSFQSIIELPVGYDLSKARAKFDNGFLRVDVPQVPPGKKTLSLHITEEQ